METKTAELLPAEKAVRERGLRVVAIGGGTGLSTLLKGLKRFVVSPTEIAATSDTPIIRDLSAVVTVSDDGQAKLWDTNSATLLFNLKAHEAAVYYADFDRDDSRIVTAGGEEFGSIGRSRDATPGQIRRV